MRKAYVITILDNERSVQVAERCIKSGKKHGLEIEKWKATTPKDNPLKIMKEYGINPQAFDEVYSRTENCMAAFLSHYSLWKHSLDNKMEVIIFEHDAVVVDTIPDIRGYQGCITFGKPSYGKYNTPRLLGVQELQHKKYFGGAHAYQVSWKAARVLVNKAKTEAAPTDVYLHLDRFRFLQEYYPWPVEARDSFSTIQVERGCLAKHKYNKETYDII
tara:strand:+ start:199 stop:849 length:651 start_codon:yes stop_codon:yes gene_type:complete